MTFQAQLTSTFQKGQRLQPKDKSPHHSYLSKKGQGVDCMWPRILCTSFFTRSGVWPSPAPPGILPERRFCTLLQLGRQVWVRLQQSLQSRPWCIARNPDMGPSRENVPKALFQPALAILRAFVTVLSIPQTPDSDLPSHPAFSMIFWEASELVGMCCSKDHRK